MRITVWNCRGLGNGPAVRGLLDLRKQEDPDLLFLSETKLDKRRMESLKWQLGMSNLVARDCEGKSGGLALLWKKEIKVELHNYSRYHIDVEITEEDGFRWRFTGIYGEPASERRNITWKLLSILNQQLSLPWLCAEDFNEIMYLHEKKGGPDRPQSAMEKFRLALAECGLRDLGYAGDMFTWRNHSHTAKRYIKERLDRAVGNQRWCQRFPAYKIMNGDPRHSDHRPVTILVEGKGNYPMERRHLNTFRFEARWLQEEECKKVVENAWATASLGEENNASRKIQVVARELKDWDHNVLGNLDKRIKHMKAELERTRRGVINQENVSRELYLREKLDKLEHQRDIYWKQRAHVTWLRSGDKNTAFFHAFASERKRRNTIRRLKREDGSWVEGEEPLKEHIAGYFYSLFTSTVGQNNEAILQTVTPKVHEGMNEILCAEYTTDEVREALFIIGDLKSPGPDGMPAIFFKEFWLTVGDQVTKEVLNILNGGEMPEGWNNTTVVLIPKKQTPESLKDLRPISLCNVLYKVVAKRKRSGAKGYAALKLDMSKAYDRVEWKFLKDMMIKLGFNINWVRLVMKCITTVKYQIKVNKDMTDVIIPQRGLRQGDPLSPYLFLICAEGFSAMLNEADFNGRLKGIKICRQAPSVSHLLFADDSLLLVEASDNAAQEVNRILSTYEACSGQMINKDKSTILFSKNTDGRIKEDMKRTLGINVEGISGKYLGLPVYMGKNKRNTFNYLREKVWKKIQGWKEKLLSKAGKEVLIKATAQAIPVYAMACFDLTKSFCEDLSAMIVHYWWSQIDKTNKIHWVSREELTKPKVDGGLGFRNLHFFNLAMLARQAWRILQNPHSFCSQVLSARYFPNGSMLEATPEAGISYTWRSILKGIQLLKKGIIWRVGNGENIQIWSDPWIPRGSTRKISTPKGRNLITKVSELIHPITNQWDADLIQQIFWPEDAQVILQIPLQEQTERENSSFEWRKLWALPLPNKVLHFLWRVATYSLPLRTKLQRKGHKEMSRTERWSKNGSHLLLEP